MSASCSLAMSLGHGNIPEVAGSGVGARARAAPQRQTELASLQNAETGLRPTDGRELTGVTPLNSQND